MDRARGGARAVGAAPALRRQRRSGSSIACSAARPHGSATSASTPTTRSSPRGRRGRAASRSSRSATARSCARCRRSSTPALALKGVLVLSTPLDGDFADGVKGALSADVLLGGTSGRLQVTFRSKLGRRAEPVDDLGGRSHRGAAGRAGDPRPRSQGQGWGHPAVQDRGHRARTITRAERSA